MSNIALPLLSEYDPATSAEGGIDPLGLYAIADALAVRLVPGVRERMSHPRYLTAIAVGTVITRNFEEHQLAADGQSEPYMVYEWHVVEGLVRSRGDDPELVGLPGSQKARYCIRDRLSLSAARYLKTATVFGFHGVYRVLANNLDIFRDGFLGERGYQLLTTWEQEQGLEGFHGGNSGPGVRPRKQVLSAVEDAMKKGALSRSGSWGGWNFFGKHLFPNKIPPKEAEFLAQTFVEDPNLFRSQVISFLASKNGLDVYDETGSEKEFHVALRRNVDEDTRLLLEAISAYENFSRLLQDAFDDCRYAMTQKASKITPAELSREAGCRKAHEEISRIFQGVADRLEPFGRSSSFVEDFGKLTENTGVESWVNTLLEHHVRIQRAKPPNGKNPWFERLDDGSVIIRPLYRRSEKGRHDGSYVNAYRTNSLRSFLSDLNMLEK